MCVLWMKQIQFEPLSHAARFPVFTGLVERQEAKREFQQMDCR